MVVYLFSRSGPRAGKWPGYWWEGDTEAGEVGAWAALRRSLIFFSEGGEQTGRRPIAVLLQERLVLVMSESVLPAR